jgi:hypothetical protein
MDSKLVPRKLDVDNASIAAQHHPDDTPPLQTPSDPGDVDEEQDNRRLSSIHKDAIARLNVLTTTDNAPVGTSVVVSPPMVGAGPTMPAASATAAAPTTSSQLTPKDVSAYLIQKDFLLTALEFHIEVII